MSYDTKEGIAGQLESYQTFYALMSARRAHGSVSERPTYSSHRLTPFTILGRYRSDEFGQCQRLSRNMFTDADRAAMPPVMTEEEFENFFEDHVRPRTTETFFLIHEGVTGMSPAFSLAPPHVICAKCGGSWNLALCHDIDSEGDFENIDLSSFAGKTLKDVETDFSARTDASRVFGHPIGIYNPEWVNPNADSEWATPEERGWRTVTMEHVVRDGDRASVFRYRFYHGECFRMINQERLAAKEAEDLKGIKEILELTAFENVSVIRTPLPEYLRKWLASTVGPSENLDSLFEAIAYYRAETKQGSFGVTFAAYPVLDLENSGVTLQDIDPDSAASVPPGFPNIIGFTGEVEQLLQLRRLLAERQIKA